MCECETRDKRSVEMLIECVLEVRGQEDTVELISMKTRCFLIVWMCSFVHESRGESGCGRFCLSAEVLKWVTLRAGVSMQRSQKEHV